MNIQKLTAFFLWCTIINGFLLVLVFIISIIGLDLITSIHSDLFQVPREVINVVSYSFLGLYKSFWLFFNVVPYVALLIIRKEQHLTSQYRQQPGQGTIDEGKLKQIKGQFKEEKQDLKRIIKVEVCLDEVSIAVPWIPVKGIAMIKSHFNWWQLQPTIGLEHYRSWIEEKRD